MIVSISSNNFGIKLIQAKPGLNFSLQLNKTIYCKKIAVK